MSKIVGFGRSRGAASKGAAASEAEKPYNVTFLVLVRNVLNRMNPSKPVGNLTSPIFGSATSLADAYAPAPEAGNRRVELQLKFKF